MSKSGFSTLNRWLGRKNKDKSMVNGKLSKSSTNLSISSTNINETSLLEYNRITPLPAATTNAPFEQTFRITVLLPKDQLYVTRLGARVPLSKLLELVCDNKLLDEEKYEFRNPVDASQVYSCDLTIGAVGLSEIRLCHKTESYDNFNSDEIIKLHRTSLIRESLSSSEFSSRNSKHTTKTASPYSSTNSLNSMDSTAVSCSGRAGNKCAPPKLTAPPRKKRAAPRPPKQTAIPEKCPLIMENGHVKEVEEELETSQQSSLTAKDLSTSTPNLASSTLLPHSDINGNDCNGHLEDFNDESSGNGSLNSHGYSEETVLYAQVQKKNALNSQSHGDLEECAAKLPEPSPRKRIVVVKKKSTAPPAPPPRNSLYQEDNISLASSTHVSGNSTPTTPIKGSAEQADFGNTMNNNLPTPTPRITTTTNTTCTSTSTSTTLLNATDVEEAIKLITSVCEAEEDNKSKANVSKVLLNRTPTPEPRAVEQPPTSYETQLEQYKQQQTAVQEEDCVSKQADSGIGEPVPSPQPDSLPCEVSTNLQVKLNNHFESSSDDDDMVKVYNFKLGKTLVKPQSETKTLEELTIMNSAQDENDSELGTPLILAPDTATPQTLSDTSSWNFAIPISPPPNFADSKFVAEPQPDAPITPKIMERPVLNFEVLQQEHHEQQQQQSVKPRNMEISSENTATAARTPLENIVQELSSVIMEKGVDSLIRRSEDPQEIEAAKPNTLSNFSINAIDCQNKQLKAKENLLAENSEQNVATDFVDNATAAPSCSPSSSPEEEKLYRKRNSVSSLKQRRAVTRSDSFHTTAAPFENLNLNKRTSSQLSLDQMAGNLNRRKSSSELSIGESPSLQSLEIIKTIILNSRKNSLANSSGEEDKEIEVNARRPSDELKFASLELKTLINSEKSEQPAVVIEQLQDTKNEQSTKELPKVYRYSGPPSINFSTWSERPKSQVAIKNEGDYIFGGGGGGGGGGKVKILAARASLNEPPPVAPKPAGPMQRMGIPEKHYKVPISVKPLKDVVIEKQNTSSTSTSTITSNYQQQEINQPKAQNTLYNAQRPTVQSVLKPQKQVLVNTSVEQVLMRPQALIITNTATLPRANKQRYSTPPAAGAAAAAAKPQLLRASSTKQPYENEVTLLPGPQILRSSSINRQETEKSMPNGAASATVAPFGQNTLRRTGYKEKMLAQEEKEQQKISNVQQNAMYHNNDLKQTNQKFPPHTVTSAKLRLNLKNLNTTTQTTCKTASPSFSSCCSPSSAVSITLGSPQLKLKPITPQTAPVVATSSTTYSTPTPTPPPPPLLPPSAVSITQLRTAAAPARSPTYSDDPRDVLLAAIRNFKREGLKKA